MLLTNGQSWLHDCGPARAFAYILRILMTGGSCVWNRMCIMSALVCENGHVLTVKLWFMAVRALAINLWYGSDIFRGPLPLGKKCSLTKCDVMGHKH